MRRGYGLSITLLTTAFVVQTCSSGRVSSDLILLVNPPTVSFGTVKKGDTAHRTVTLKHAGTSGTIRIEAVEREDGTSIEFSLDPLPVQELNPGESTVLQIHYSPQDSVADQGAVVLRHNIASQGFKTRIPLIALAQVASLTCDPNPLDFGQVRSGEVSPPRDLILRNDGSDDMVVERLPYLRVDSSRDFRQVGDPVIQGGGSFPVTLKPGEFIGLVYEYQPTGGGADDGYLVVDTETKGVKSTATCNLHGVEVGPRIVTFPGEIHLGDVLLNETRAETVTIENQGFSINPEDSMLVIPAGGITFAPGSNEELGLADAQGNPVTSLPPEDWKLKSDTYADYPEVADIPTSRTFQVTWKPTKTIPDTGEPIGWLVIPSNDFLYNPVQIAIRGRVAAPYIAVFPNPVDFSVIGQQITGEQTLTVQNLGNADLSFTAPFTIENDALGEFAVVPDPKFKPTSSTFDPATDCQNPEDCVIHGNNSRGVVLQFTNKGPASGTATARLVIRSNDPSHPTLYVDLRATRGGTPTCEPVLVPGKLDYGVVPKGYFKEMTMKLVNNGTGYCSFQTARVEDCSGLFGTTTTCAEPGKGTISKVFSIMGLPPAVQNGLKPKSNLDFKIRFTPPVNESIFAQLMSYTALFSVQVYDSQLKQTKTVPTCTGGGFPGMAGCSPNLQAQSGVAKISVMPGEVNFGLITIGCYSKTHKICIYNSGTAPLTISNISTAGCSPEFKKKNVPGLPKTVSAGVPVCFEMVYVPQDEGPDQCLTKIESTDSSAPLVSVILKGEGTYENEHTDLFTQVTGQEVDVLFLVDDSGSMCEEQDRLAAGFDYFIKNAKVWNNDYHIGIAGVNVVDDTIMGMLNYGNPKKMPRFLTPSTPDQKTKFKEFTALGCNGGPNCGGFNGPCTDQQEAGLLAAQIALSAPLTTDTGVACNSDSDCKNNPNVCPDPSSCPYRCLDKTCGGWNKGFIRENAQLEIVVLSDEEDQSPGAVSTYIDFLKSIKGFYNVKMMHFHSIVGANPPTCQESDAGKRYIQVSQETNGVIGDICDANYFQTMAKIGEVTFGLKVQFFLTRLAEPGTVKVWVNDKPCTSGWSYDGLSNSVVFDEKGACMPQPGDKIKVYYKTLCLKE